MNSTPFSPPPGFQSVPSALDGITVYAQAPEAPVEETASTFTCPNCGASTRFNVAVSGVACEHCGFSSPAEITVHGLRAQENEFTLDSLQSADEGWGIARNVLHCDHCGAELSIPLDALTVTCPFCASNKVNVRTAPGIQLRPRFLIPFKIQPDQLSALSMAWLGKGWFHPAELGKSAPVARFSGVYLPFWTFDADITSNWRAEVGYERQERHYNAQTKSWDTRTVIDWRWEKGTVPLTVDDHMVCGTTRVSHRILNRLLPFPLESLVAYQPDFLAGWQAHLYDIPLDTAWDKAKADMREQAKQACYDSINSSHVRNFSMTADFAKEVWRFILLPVYLAAYSFNNKVYQVMINGQTGTIAGQKPVAWWKVWLAISAMFSPALILALIGILTIALGGIGLLLMAAAFVCLILAGFAAYHIYRKAIDSEAA